MLGLRTSERNARGGRRNVVGSQARTLASVGGHSLQGGQSLVQRASAADGETLQAALEVASEESADIAGGAASPLQAHALEASPSLDQPGTEPEPLTEQQELNLGRKKDLARHLAAWQKQPEWSDQPPELQVGVPKDAFIELNCQFVVALPPDAVFEILCLQENRRAFRNIKEVKSRKVLEDTGDFQRLVMEQTAIWRFLGMSGTFDVCMEIEQDRTKYQIAWKLSKEGFMKRFEGSWRIQSVALLPGAPVPPPHTWTQLQSSVAKEVPDEVAGQQQQQHPAGEVAQEGEDPVRLASLVTLKQVMKPAMVPRPPFDRYARRISAAAVRQLCSDLQNEARRIREGRVVEGILIQADSSEKNSSRREGKQGASRWELVGKGSGSGGLRIPKRTVARKVR